MPHIQIGAEKLFTIYGFPITNSLLLEWGVVLVIVFFIQAMARKMSLVPKGFQNVVEALVEGLIGFMKKTLHTEKRAIQYLPFIATIFIMIVLSNWAGILPGVGSIGVWETHGKESLFIPLFRSPASDLNFTLALAIISVLMVNVFGVAALGLGKYITKFFDFSSPIKFFVGILELVGEGAKLVSLAFRLFGNIFAGEVLLIIVGFLAPYIAPLPFLILEIFVGAIQALIFATLTMVFIGLATEEHS